MKISPTLFHPHYSCACSSQKSFVPALASFAAIGAKGRVFLILNNFLKFGCFSRCHTQLPGKNTLHIPMQNFNSASKDTNFNETGQTTVEIGYCFFLAPSLFSANLLKFNFSVFPDPSGRVDKFSLVPDDGEKLGGTF